MNNNDKIQIDFSLIPEHVKESLAAATLECIREFKKNPETNKLLNEKKKQLFGVLIDN